MFQPFLGGQVKVRAMRRLEVMTGYEHPTEDVAAVRHWNLARTGLAIGRWVLEGFLIVALTALIFGKFCLGSYVYYLIKGEIRFANRTLPLHR